MKFGVNSAGDWLPPVLGPGDWSSAVMASMADRDAAWYFGRRQDDRARSTLYLQRPTTPRQRLVRG
jgi:hypothetical protein